jgi:hypothetical protein
MCCTNHTSGLAGRWTLGPGPGAAGANNATTIHQLNRCRTIPLGRSVDRRHAEIAACQPSTCQPSEGRALGARLPDRGNTRTRPA